MFTAVLKKPVFSYSLDYRNNKTAETSIYFFVCFKGEKNDMKFCELSTTLTYFALKARKKSQKRVAVKAYYIISILIHKILAMCLTIAG